MKKRKLFTSILIALVLLTAFAIGLVVATLRLSKQLVNTADVNYPPAELYQRAVRQTEVGDYATAELYLEQALQQEKADNYRNQLAVVKYRLKKYEESITNYQLLVEKGTDVAFSQNGIGNAYRDWALEDESLRVGREARAEAAYRAAIAADASYVAAYSNLALLLNSQGKRSEALVVLDEGIARTKQSELTQLKARL